VTLLVERRDHKAQKHPAISSSVSTPRACPALLVVSVTQGLYARDQAGAGGSHEEHSGGAQDDARRPEAPRAQEVAQDPKCYPYRSSRQIHACAQEGDDKAARAQEQPYHAADPAQEQLECALLPISLYDALFLHIVLPFFRPPCTQVYSGSGYLVLLWGEIQQALQVGVYLLSPIATSLARAS
jgi:hypothetical protein